MSYITKKAVERYYETLIYNNTQERDVKKIGISGNIIFIETLNKLFIKSIKR